MTVFVLNAPIVLLGEKARSDSGLCNRIGWERGPDAPHVQKLQCINTRVGKWHYAFGVCAEEYGMFKKVMEGLGRYGIIRFIEKWIISEEEVKEMNG